MEPPSFTEEDYVSNEEEEEEYWEPATTTTTTITTIGQRMAKDGEEQQPLAIEYLDRDPRNWMKFRLQFVTVASNICEIAQQKCKEMNIYCTLGDSILCK